MKKYEITFSTVVYVEANNEEEARELATEELGDIDLVGSQELTSIEEIE